MRHADRNPNAIEAPLEASLDALPRYALAIGLALVVLLPAARGFSQTLGWLPLWLLAMPAVALWALRLSDRMRRDGDQGAVRPDHSTAARRRRSEPQARRRNRPALRPGVSRAA
ncbi:hypothetical protein [Lysobacter fragariae]